LESLDEHPKFVLILDELDALFRGLVTEKSHSKHIAGSLLAMNSHAAFLAAVGSALRGQSPPTFMILRGCIESALYAFLVAMDKADGEAWFKRSQDPETVRAKFTANRAIQKLTPHDPNLAAMVRDTYQWTIEFGAHPNRRSVLDHIRLKAPISEGYPVSMTYIHSSDSAVFIRGLNACIENGCMCLAILCHAIPDHPAMSATFERVWIVFKEFQDYLEKEGYLTQTAPS
jgi:hypothetical protein